MNFQLLMIIAAIIAIASIVLGASPAVRDAALKLTRALPNGAATVTSASIDTGKTTSLAVQGDG